MMRTGFQRDIDGRPTRRRPSLSQGHNLGMRAATGLGPAPPDDPISGDNHATDRWVRPTQPKPSTAQAQRMGHMAQLRSGHHRPAHLVGGVSGRSSLTNLSKSSAAWKFL